MHSIFFAFAGLVALSLASPQARAQEAPASDGKGDTVMMREVGAGVVASNNGGSGQVAGVVQSMNGQMGNGSPGPSGSDGTVYAFGNASIDAGQAGIGFDFRTHVGKNFVARDKNQGLVPLLGFEPLNFAAGSSIGFDREQDTVHREPGRTPYFQYMPMGVAGVQLFTSACQATALARAGIALGTEVTQNDNAMGAAWSYGIGLEAMCGNKFMLDAELTRVTDGSSVSDEASLMAAVKIPGTSWAVGVDLDGREAKSFNQANPVYGLPVSPDAGANLSAKAFAGVVF